MHVPLTERAMWWAIQLLVVIATAYQVWLVYDSGALAVVL